MPTLRVSLFGRFSARYHDQPLRGWESQKVQELVAYLLLHPNRPHHRELLADVLWGETCTTNRSKAYLRKTLWKLQAALQKPFGPAPPFLHVEPEWVRLDLVPPLTLDVARFDEVARLDVSSPPYPTERVDAFREACALYTADLLEGWTHPWCLLERERLRYYLLLMLDSLMDGCEAHGDFEAAIAYGHRALRYDCARESTHRHLMRLYLRRRDRTGALRQFRSCERALAEELDVRPSQLTLSLYKVACDGVPLDSPLPHLTPAVQQDLLQLQGELTTLQKHLHQTLQTLSAPPPAPPRS